MSNLDFIVAKVRGMRGHLYEGEKLRGFCDFSSIEDLAARLAPHEPIGTAVALQRSLTARHVDGLHKILSHLDGWEAEMLTWMLRRHQVENLKVILRAWAAKAGEETLAAYTVELPPPLDLPMKDLAAAASMEELVTAIPVEQIKEGALWGLGDFEESGRLFFIEAGMDKAYLSELHNVAGQAAGDARAHVLKLVMLELDIYNVMFVIRALFNYSMIFNKIRPFLAPFGASVGMSVVNDVRNAPDADTTASLIPASLTGRQNRPSHADEAEVAMWNTLYRVANRLYYTAVLDFGAVVAFHYIKRIELANLIRISECIRYGESGDTVRQKLMQLPTAELVGV